MQNVFPGSVPDNFAEAAICRLKTFGFPETPLRVLSFRGTFHPGDFHARKENRFGVTGSRSAAPLALALGEPARRSRD